MIPLNRENILNFFRRRKSVSLNLIRDTDGLDNEKCKEIINQLVIDGVLLFDGKTFRIKS